MSDGPQTDTFKAYALKLIDQLYHISFYSIVAYSVLMFMLVIIAMMVMGRVVEVPEFHPR